MIKKFHILILEDHPTDAELELRELKNAGLDFDALRVESKETFLNALEEFCPDIIISDFGLPQFNGLEALRLVRKLKPELPFILCTGTLTEELAVECMKEGATDYILKTSLKRLPSAVLNGLEKSKSRQAEEKALAALRESEERLQQAQKMEAVGTLTSGVAHDFNNLLTAILGNAQLARRKLAPDHPVRLHLAEIAHAGNRASELTRKLLAFSRRQHLKRRQINLNESIAEITKLLERIIGADVEVVVKYADDLEMVFADPAQIEQVVMNLAVNARDAMPSGGLLTIETSNVNLDDSYIHQYPYVIPGRYVQILVSDTGTGMDKETQARIFEPFFTTKAVGKGTGLGLSMAYGIIKQHDGHIHVYSEPGHGTTFKIFLSTNVKSTIGQEEETIKLAQPSLFGGTETILVAEDEEPLQNIVKDTLEELGYTVLLAKDGEEAVEIFQANSERIDLFLSDVIMPRMGGSEAYERIRELGGNIPLIFMTGYSSEIVRSRLAKTTTPVEELNAMIIQKPYSLDTLGRKVREALDKNKSGEKI